MSRNLRNEFQGLECVPKSEWGDDSYNLIGTCQIGDLMTPIANFGQMEQAYACFASLGTLYNWLGFTSGDKSHCIKC